MRTFCYILCMEWAMVAAVLCVAGGRARPRWAVALPAAGLAPLLQLGALAALGPLWPALTPTGRLLISLLAGWSLLVWLGAVRGERQKILPPLVGAPPRHPPWSAFGLALILLTLALTVWLQARWQHIQDPYTPLPASWLAGSLGAGMLSGALLMVAACRGLVASYAAEGTPTPALPGIAPAEGGPAGLYNAVLWLELATLLRWVTLAAGMALGAACNPIGPHYFLRRMLLVGGPLLLARVFLGLILPLPFGWLALLALRGGDRRQAARTFLPATIVVMVGEILAATLTAGLSGIAF